jgi:hypothetical protein
MSVLNGEAALLTQRAVPCAGLSGDGIANRNFGFKFHIVEHVSTIWFALPNKHESSVSRKKNTSGNQTPFALEILRRLYRLILNP